jgi:glutaminyl-tRNA synthetase
MDNTEDLLTAFNLNADTIKMIVKKSDLRDRLSHLIALSEISSGPKSTGEMLYELSTTLPSNLVDAEKFFCLKVASGNLHKKEQLKEAYVYLKTVDSLVNIDEGAFDTACGVGVEVTAEEVGALVDSLFEEYKNEIEEKKWGFNFGSMIH